MRQDMKVFGKFAHNYSFVKKLLFLVAVLLCIGATNVLGVNITYHIINLGKLDNNGDITTSDRTEALKFTSTETTLGVPDKYKSPLAKSWTYYQASEVTYNSSTKVCTFNSGPTLYEGQTMADDADTDQSSRCIPTPSRSPGQGSPDHVYSFGASFFRNALGEIPVTLWKARRKLE